MSYDDFKKEVDQHINTLVLDGFKVVKLAGVCRDEVDYYYILFDYEGKEYHLSSVGGITIIKNKIDKKRYDHLVWQWNEFFKCKYENLITE